MAASPSRCSPVLVLFVSASCAHQPEHVTWEHATRTEASLPDGGDARASSSSSGARPRLAKARGAIDLAAPAGAQIDRALSRFSAERVNNDRLPPTSPAHGRAWLDVLAAVDEAVQVAPVAGDLGGFVRARVMLEVEYERDKQKRRVVPDDLLARIRRSLLSVDQRVSELRMMGATGTFKPPPRLVEGELILNEPVQPMVVSSVFGLREDPIHGARRFHAGIDVAAPEGTPVSSSAHGLVIYAGWQGGYGKHIVVDHGEGVRTHYSHLEDVFVKPGQVVELRQTIGTVGETGRATGPHLHFAVTDGEGRFRNPLDVLFTPFPIHVIDDAKKVSRQAPDDDQARLAASSSSR